jgi:hypothetical protein
MIRFSIEHIIIGIALIFTVFLGSCSESCESCNNLPASLCLQVVDAKTGYDLLHGSSLKNSNIELYYKEKNISKPVNFDTFSDPASESVFIRSSEISFLTHRGIHVFYLSGIDGSEIELQVFYQQMRYEEQCCMEYLPQSVYQNGEKIELEYDFAANGFIAKISPDYK